MDRMVTTGCDRLRMVHDGKLIVVRRRPPCSQQHVIKTNDEPRALTRCLDIAIMEVKPAPGPGVYGGRKYVDISAQSHSQSPCLTC
jgi:hypothetical protein